MDEKLCDPNAVAALACSAGYGVALSGKVYRPGPYRLGLRPALCAAQRELVKQCAEIRFC